MEEKQSSSALTQLASSTSNFFSTNLSKLETGSDLVSPLSFHSDIPNSKHISNQYGMQFKSKVPLFQRSYASNIVESMDLDQIPKEDIFRKVFNFLKELSSSPESLKRVLKSLEFRQKQLEVSMISSPKSSMSRISQTESQKSYQMQSNFPLINIINASDTREKTKEPNKCRISLMSKYNRISITNAIMVDLEIKNGKESGSIVEEESRKSISSNSSQTNLKSFKTKKIFEDQIDQTQSNELIPIKKKQCYLLPTDQSKQRQKKISIMLNSDFSIKEASCSFFSSGSLNSFSNIKFPNIDFNLKLVERIFDLPEPFLINLSVCLMLKFINSQNQGLPSQQSLSWMLSISTIIAYKIYYDEQIEGLIECFCQIVCLKDSEIIDLQRLFLSTINYEAVITNSQYHNVLFRIISQQ